MQERHKNRKKYFNELAETCRKYFLPYIERWHIVEPATNVLEIGCGEGGNLLPFSELGCNVVGVDIASCRIKEAKSFFEDNGATGQFIAEDIFKLRDMERKFDIIICHDVFEHIDDKMHFLLNIKKYLSDNGIVFMSFPAWQMPFGGHQQICRSRVLSHLPFVHLLPCGIYKLLINAFGEDSGCMNELVSIRNTRITIERFERLSRFAELKINDRQLWLVNPHYEVKFGLKPYKMPQSLAHFPYIRDFFSTSCFYILSK